MTNRWRNFVSRVCHISGIVLVPGAIWHARCVHPWHIPSPGGGGGLGFIVMTASHKKSQFAGDICVLGDIFVGAHRPRIWLFGDRFG